MALGRRRHSIYGHSVFICFLSVAVCLVRSQTSASNEDNNIYVSLEKENDRTSNQLNYPATDQFALNGPVDLGPQRPGGQFPPSQGPIDLGPQRPGGQFPPSHGPIDLGPQRPGGQFPPSQGPIDLGPQRPGGQFPPSQGPIDLGPQRPGGQFPPSQGPTDLGPQRPGGQFPPSQGPIDLGPQRPGGQFPPSQGPTDLGPQRPGGQFPPSQGPIDLGPQRPGGQFPPTNTPIDLGPQRPSGQFPQSDIKNQTSERERGEMSQDWNIGPHRPNGNDPNGPYGSNGDLGPHRPQGMKDPNGPPIPPDIGPQRPSGQFPPEAQHDNMESYTVTWDVPTFMCHRYGFPFANLTERYGIVQNPDDVFRGKDMTILYDPGLYPAIVENSQGQQQIRNGGVPQEGNLQLHLNRLQVAVNDQVPEDFDGLGVIDFEAWRPVWAQNFGTLSVYQNYSIELERKRTPLASSAALRHRAKLRFEEGAKRFFLESLKLAQKLRPNGKWGYYAFPYCFNQTPNNPGSSCPSNVQRQNDQINWLFETSTALYPSIYLSQTNKSHEDQVGFITGRLQEAARVSKGRRIVYPYTWYRYHDVNQFLSQDDLDSSLGIPHTLEMPGAIIWGSSSDLNSSPKCSSLNTYLDSTLGPTAVQNT